MARTTWASSRQAGRSRCACAWGLQVKLANFIGEDPYIFGAINSIATDEDGNLYAMAHAGGANQNFDTLRVFTPEGKYLRTLIPFSADLPAEAAAAAATFDAASKTFRPKNQSSQLPVFYPWGSGARLVSASKKGGIVLTFGTDVYRMDLNGGNVKGPAPMWNAKSGLKNPAWNIPQLTVSADGRYIYYSNVANTQYDTKAPGEIGAAFPQGRVYRQDSTKSGADPEKYFDLTLPDWSAAKYWMPNAWNKRTASYGMNLDAKGDLYVCDLVNQEVAQVGAEGKKTAAAKAPWPERVHVNPAGDLYVVCRLEAPKDGFVGKKLVKITGRNGSAKVVAELPLKGHVGEASALGMISGKPVLWLAGGGEMWCVQDQGSAFGLLETAFKPRPNAQVDWNRIGVDPERDEVYTSNGVNNLWRYDGKTGQGDILKLNHTPFLGVDLAVGYDGLLYIRTGASYSGPLERYTHDLKPAPFASGSHVLSNHIYSRFGVGNCEKGLGVGPKGECYINFMYGWNKYFIAGFGADGKAIEGNYLKGKAPGGKGYPAELNSAVVGPITASSGGIRVDVRGNIYLGLRLLPKDFVRPAGFEKDQAYNSWTGSVVKFPPSGGTVQGEIKDDDQPASGTGTGTIPVDRGLVLAGATAVYGGIGPFSGNGWGGGGSCCVCRVPRFDVDRYGRIVMPNVVTNSVLLLDNAGNKILEFGAYGNFDSQFKNPNLEAGKAGKPTVAVPEIPLTWPTGAGFSEQSIYVNDTYSRRALRVERVYAAEAVCAVK